MDIDVIPTVAEAVLAPLDQDLPALRERYIDLHRNPELSFQEMRTAGIVADALTAPGDEGTPGVGRTGVVGILRNGDGPTVALRADMDALPVTEETGLPYASEVVGTDPQGRSVGVMHACGHDAHTTCMIGSAALLARCLPTARVSLGRAPLSGRGRDRVTGGLNG